MGFSSLTRLFRRSVFNRSDLPLEERALYGDGYLHCSCGHDEYLPDAETSAVPERCGRCGNGAIDVRSHLLLGTRQETLDRRVTQTAYLFDVSLGKFFLAKRFEMTLALEYSRETLFGPTPPHMVLVEQDPSGWPISRVETSLDDKAVREAFGRFYSLASITESGLLPQCGVETKTLPDFAHVWLAAVLMEKKEALIKKSPGRATAERLCTHLAIPALQDEPVAIVGIDKIVLERGVGSASFETLCADVFLAHHKSKSVRRAFFKALDEAAKLGIEFNIRGVLLLDRVFKDPNHVVSLMGSLSMMRPVYSLDAWGFSALQAALTEMVRQRGETVIARAMLHHKTAYWGGFLRDALEVWSRLREFEPITCSTFAQLHDQWMIRTQIADDTAFGYPDSWLAYEGFSADKELEFRLPKSPNELASWGVAQHNCLGWRIEKVARLESVILGIFKDGQHLYTCEALPMGELIELRASRNRPAPKEIEQAVIAHLAGHSKEAFVFLKTPNQTNTGYQLEHFIASLNNLAASYCNTSHLEEGIALCEEAVEIIKPLYQSDPDRWVEYYTRTLNYLAYCYYNTQNTQKAIFFFEEAYGILKPLFHVDPDRWVKYYVPALDYLACCYNDVNRTPEAIVLEKEALEIQGAL